ncbi:hypothetical protein QJQ45_003739 [Haematococcus lacustris]|nr:hypothetical protein QJQ45_003739 [Haematococcus lacustris]
MGAVNPLAHLHAEWLGVDPGKTNMATVAHKERSADGSVVSVRHWKLTAGQYYRDSGITWQAQATKIWLAKVKTQLTALSQVSSKPSSLASYRRFADTVPGDVRRHVGRGLKAALGQRQVQAVLWQDARGGFVLGQGVAAAHQAGQAALAGPCPSTGLWAAGFSGSGSVGCRGVPVSQMLKEALRQFPTGQVLMVDEFRTSQVCSAYTTPVRPSLGSHQRPSVSPGPRPTELCHWEGPPAMPKRGRPGQEWVYLRDKALLPTSIGTRGGWGADAVLRACRKVVCRPRGKDQDGGRVVLVDEHRTSRVSSAVNGQQPCERQLNKRRATRPANWKPPAGQVEHRLVRPAWSQQRDQPVRGMMWCPVVAPRKPPQAPRSSQEASQPAASEPGPSTPLPAKRSKRTKAEPAAEPNKGKAKGKAAKAKPAPQPGSGGSKWRPLELCFWPEQGALPAKGKEYPGLGYKRLRNKPPKAQEQQPAVAQ